MLKEYLNKPLALSLVVLGILLVGIFCIFSIPIKMYPNMAKPGFQVWYGHKEIIMPNDIYKNYGINLERQISQIEGIEEVRASYYKGRGRSKIECEWNVDEEDIKQKLTNLFNTEKSKDTNKFWFHVQSNSDRSSGNMMIAVGHQSMNSTDLKELLDKQLMSNIKQIEGVRRANFWGWSYRRVFVEVDRNKMISFNLTVSEISAKIRQSIESYRVGNLYADGGKDTIEISMPAKIDNIEKLEEIVLRYDLKSNLIIRLKDIAKVTRKLIDKQDSLYRLDGISASYLWVGLEKDGDVKRAADKVTVELEKFKSKFSGIHFNVIINPATFIQKAINNLLGNALMGGSVAILLIFLFLGNFRNTMIVAISIPFCAVSSFALMKAFGVTTNIISLGGMAIGVGMIVDSSIVSLENIYRRLSENKENKEYNDLWDTVISSTKEVAIPIIASILTSIVVFSPIIFTSSYTQGILGDLSKTVVFILTISIFAALVIVPGIGGRFISTSKSKIVATIHKKNKFTQWYLYLLNQVIKTKLRALGVILIVSLIFTGSLFIIPKIKKEIIAKPATTLFDISMNMSGNDDIDITKRNVNKIETYLKSKKEIVSYATYFWSASDGFITAKLTDKKHFETLKKEMKEKFPDTPELQVNALKWDPGKMPLPRHNDMSVRIFGVPNKEMVDFSDKLMALANKENINNRRKPRISSNESIKVSFYDWVEDQSAIRSYLSVASKEGSYIVNMVDESSSRDINLIFLPAQRANYLEDLKILPIPYQKKLIPLKALAEVKIDSTSYMPSMSLDQKRIQEVTLNFKGDDLSDSKKEIEIEKFKKKIESIEKPFDLGIEYPDNNKEINASFSSFKSSLLISIFLVFMIIAIIFNSFKYPMIILATVPFAIIGVIWGLYICSSTLSLNSMLGTILLSGLVVNNAILFIDFYKRRCAEDLLNTAEGITCISEAAKLRLRPIIMTTMTTLFGILPIALAFGESGEILQPLGISIFFGLLISSILGLFVIPCFIRLVDFYKI